MPSADDITRRLSEGPCHFERIAGPVDGAALIAAAATVLGVGLVRRPAQRKPML
jgi:hypothetical protein